MPSVPDTPWQRGLARTPSPTTRPRTRTPRSLRSRATWSEPRPMDRLLCGDVGYGKTEVAMRAAFKAVDAGYQVAVLVPTTLLAEQHIADVRRGRRSFPFEIATLSRFATAQAARPGSSAARRRVDRHRDRHAPARPSPTSGSTISGLVIIDEEQRFGVEVKERLKALRQIVDVLTMTATPIPRDAAHGPAGRDISQSRNAAGGDRLAVETRVARFDPELIRRGDPPGAEPRRAGLLRPQPRDDIERVGHAAAADRARGPAGRGPRPDAEHDLEQVMLDFLDHRFDLLSGHHDRGEAGWTSPTPTRCSSTRPTLRAGRSAPASRPGGPGTSTGPTATSSTRPEQPLTETAPTGWPRSRSSPTWGPASRWRCGTWRSAGPAISSGGEQSGHIADVGFDLYVRLVGEALAEYRGEEAHGRAR